MSGFGSRKNYLGSHSRKLSRFDATYTFRNDGAREVVTIYLSSINNFPSGLTRARNDESVFELVRATMSRPADC